MKQQLEQMLEFAPTKEVKPTIDLYAAGITVLYTGPSFGLMNSQPFQMGYDLPESGMQLHLHGPSRDYISYGTLQDYSGNVFKELNGYESSMASLRADLMGFKKFP